MRDYTRRKNLHHERSAKGVDGKTTFSEGIYVGYRWFDKEKIEPQFPFGFGLSYTQFEYSNLTFGATTDDGSLTVRFNVKNTGSVASDEVPQIYLGQPDQKQTGDFPERELAAFDRIHLDPGQAKAVTLVVPQRRLQYWSTEAGQWATAVGPRPVYAGRSSRDLPLSATVTIQ